MADVKVTWGCHLKGLAIEKRLDGIDKHLEKLTTIAMKNARMSAIVNINIAFIFHN
jgi:hypothetical protein